MNLFSRKTPDDDAEPQPLDPVAVTLAIWLGLIVGVTGLIRMSANAVQTAQTRTEAQAPGTHRPMPFRVVAFGT